MDLDKLFGQLLHQIRSDRSAKWKLLAAAAVAVMPFGLVFLAGYALWRHRGRWHGWLTQARFVPHELDGCMGRETRYKCEDCGTVKVQSHVARDAGFSEDFSPEWQMSSQPCKTCLRESAPAAAVARCRDYIAPGTLSPMPKPGRP